MIGLDLNPPYLAEILIKHYSVGHIAPQFQKFGDRRGNTSELIIRFLDFVGAHFNDQNLSPTEFFKYLTNHAYTSYMNLSSGSVHD